MIDPERLAKALDRIGPGTIEDMAWSHHKWVEGEAYMVVVEDDAGRPVPDDYRMASLAAVIAAAYADLEPVGSPLGSAEAR